MKTLGFLALLAFAITGISVVRADLPPSGKTTSDTAIYQGNSEISVPRQGRLSFDRDLKNLNEMESRYHERLPRLSERPELASPMKRISHVKYHAKQRAGRAAPAIKKMKAVRKPKGERSSHLKPGSNARHDNLRIIMPDNVERERPRSRD